MLPSELLLTRKKKDRIYPAFVQIDAEHKELAAELIEVYTNFTGKKKSEIDELVTDLEQGLNFKLVRGLRTLLERRCTFNSKFRVEPVLARKAVFEAANTQKVTSYAEREAVLESVAAYLNIPVPDLELSLWADQDSEVVLDAFTALNPEELLKAYNLSLAQTLLFKATGMTLAFKSNSKAIFRAIKHNGLMYTLKGDKIRIEGASSLLKLSERYGTSLARLLPAIANSDEWAIDAEIVVRRATPRIYHFMLDSSSKKLLRTNEQAVKLTFDSLLEERFYNGFLSTSAANSWDLIREPDAVFTSKGVSIPDFKFKHKETGTEIYFEIVGYWTEDYLRKKLSKLRAMQTNILVAIDRSLACFNALQFDLELDQPVILFSGKVPVGDVVRFLAKIEREAIKKQAESFMGTRIELEGDIILIKDIAARYGIGTDAVRACFDDPGYVVFKEVVAKNELLQEVKEKLVSVRAYVEARGVIDGFGLPNPDEVLAELGFTVNWKGLDPDAASIKLPPTTLNS